jgi:predicted ATPase
MDTFLKVEMKPTNWCVITGAPCSGKSAAICLLESRGYRVIPEVARALIERELEQGRTLQEIKADIHDFETRIFQEKRRIEDGLSEKELVFFDRGLPDSIAYFRIEGLDPTPVMAQSRLRRYRAVFYFDRLELESDSVRSEDDVKVAALGTLLEESYRQLGYRIIRIPLLPVSLRVEKVLSHL